MIEGRFDHVGINVKDLDGSIAFFKAVFDFKVIQRWEAPRQAFLGKGQVVLGIMEKPEYDFTVHTMAHIAFPCSEADFELVVQKVRQSGAEIVSGPKPQRQGETVLFRDPSGNIFEVCYPPVMNA